MPVFDEHVSEANVLITGMSSDSDVISMLWNEVDSVGVLVMEEVLFPIECAWF